MKITNFNSNIDFNKVIAFYDIFKSNLKESFEVFYILSQLASGKIEAHKSNQTLFSVPSRSLEGIIGRNKEHLFYQVFEEALSYSFNNFEDKYNQTRGYKIKEEYLDIIYSHHFISDCIYKYTKNKHKIVTIYIIDVEFYVSYYKQQEVKEKLNMNNKQLDLIKEWYLNCFEGFDTKKVKHLINSKEDKFSVVHKTKYNLNSLEEYIKYQREHPDLQVTKNIQLFNYYVALRTSKEDSFNNQIAYVRKGGGRLYQVSTNWHSHTAQQLSKEERKALFKDQFEYDISNSVVTILYQDYRQKINNSLEMKGIEDYIKNKEKYRLELVKLGFSYEQAKMYYISIFFGADLTSNIHSLYAFSKLKMELGKDNLDRAFKVEMVQELVKEVYEVFSELGDYYKGLAIKSNNGWVLTNCRGITSTFNRWNNAKVLSFIYNGIESSILDYIYLEYLDSLSLMIFDAFILDRDLGLKELIELSIKIKNKLGYYVKFEKNKL